MKIQSFPFRTYSACFALIVLGGCAAEQDLGNRPSSTSEGAHESPGASDSGSTSSTASNPPATDDNTATTQSPTTNRTGSLDTTFGTDGRLRLDELGIATPTDVFVSADDFIFVLSNCDLAKNSITACVVRLTPNGALDTTYGDGGIVKLDGLGATSGVLLSDGRIVVGGTKYKTNPSYAAYGVIAADGQSNVVSPFPWPTPVGFPGVEVSHMALAPDGGVVMVFDLAVEMIGIAKITNAGEFDSQFGVQASPSQVAGFASARFADSPCSTATGILVKPNGRIMITGSQSDCQLLNPTGQGFLQLDDKGFVDTSFGTNGQVLVTNSKSGIWPYSWFGNPVLSPDNRIYVPEMMGTWIHAFTLDGTPDATFCTDGSCGSGRVGTWRVGSDYVSYPSVPMRVFLDNQKHLLVPEIITYSPISDDGALERIWHFPVAGSVGEAKGLRPTGWAPANSVAARVQSDDRIIVLSSLLSAGNYGELVVSRFWNWD